MAERELPVRKRLSRFPLSIPFLFVLPTVRSLSKAHLGLFQPMFLCFTRFKQSNNSLILLSETSHFSSLSQAIVSLDSVVSYLVCRELHNIYHSSHTEKSTFVPVHSHKLWFAGLIQPLQKWLTRTCYSNVVLFISHNVDVLSKNAIVTIRIALTFLFAFFLAFDLYQNCLAIFIPTQPIHLRFRPFS